MRRKWMRVLLAVFAAVLALSLRGPAVQAANAKDPEDGSITLLLGEGADHRQNPLRGGVIALYRVASVHIGDERYYDAGQGQFAGSGKLSGLRAITQSELDRQNAALAEALAGEAKSGGIRPLSTAAVTDGKVYFSGLSVGLYLVTQLEDSEGGRRMNAFLISIPDAGGARELVAAPKPGFYTPTEAPSPTPAPPPEIPQTGQLWWPVPVLAILGFGLLAFGFALRRRDG